MSGVNIGGSYEQIMTALLAWVKTHTGGNTIVPTFATYARGIRMWEELGTTYNTSGAPILRQPALFLYDGVGFGGGRTRYEQRGRTLPVVRIIHRTFVIYARLPAPVTQPGGTVGGKMYLPLGGGPILHPLIQAVETAMELSDDPQQDALTLGGLVSHAWISGESLVVTGEIDDQGQGMATIPVEIMVPLGVGIG